MTTQRKQFTGIAPGMVIKAPTADAMEYITTLRLYSHSLHNATYCKSPTGLLCLPAPLFCLWLGLPLCTASTPDSNPAPTCHGSCFCHTPTGKAGQTTHPNGFFTDYCQELFHPKGLETLTFCIQKHCSAKQVVFAFLFKLIHRGNMMGVKFPSKKKQF